MIELRPVPRKTVRAIARRLHRTTPAANLISDSVKHCPIPGTRFDASVFIFELRGVFHFVSELCVPGLPHIFHSFTAATDSPRDNAENLIVSLVKLKEAIEGDARFGNYMVRLNGSGLVKV